MFDTDFNVIYLRVIGGCNLNCTHCFTLGNRDKVKKASDNDIKGFLQAIRKNINPKKVALYLHGGETFLRPISELTEIVQYARNILNESEVIILPQTNLVYKLTPEWIRFVKEVCSNEVGISWDYQIRFGSIRTDKAIEKEQLFFNNLQILLDNDIHVHVAITVQRHLLKADPIKILESFTGVKSIDFELLTAFDDKTRNLVCNNKEWSDWYFRIVEYYRDHDVSWSLPQMDLLFKSMLGSEPMDCKCNCCNKRTFTLNPNGTVGLCPDHAYISPISTAEEMNNDWSAFTQKAQETLIQDLIDKSSTLCYDCEHYEICAGNCNSELFDETNECPLSRKAIGYAIEHKKDFLEKYKKSMENLPELRKQR